MDSYEKKKTEAIEKIKKKEEAEKKKLIEGEDNKNNKLTE